MPGEFSNKVLQKCLTTTVLQYQVCPYARFTYGSGYCSEGTYRKVMAKYANPVLLILDEWMLLKPTDTEQKDIFELLHRRRKKSSTIFCSQYVFGEWYDQLGGEASPLADAIIDRIAHDSYQINITSIDAKHDKSMREVYGLDKT